MGVVLIAISGIAVIIALYFGIRLEWGPRPLQHEVAPDSDVKFIDANGIKFGYIENGKGPLVLLFHGYPETARSWREIQARLSSEGYHVVVPFLRGYPPTSSPPDGDYRGQVLGQDILALIDAFKVETAIVVGHDWGASAAYIAATKKPEKIEKLVAISMPHPRGFEGAVKFFSSAPHFLYYQLPWARRIVWSHDFAHIGRLYRKCAPNYRPSTEVLEEIKSTLKRPGALEGALGYYWSAFKGRQGEVSGGDSVSVPSLVIAGSDDGPIDIAMFAKARPAFIGPYFFVELATGHFPQLEAPEEVADAILSFLKEAE